MKYKLAYKFK